MDRRERRYGRMYLLPLMLGLTGIALLVLEWVLRLQGADSAGTMDAALRAGNLKDVFLHSGLLKSLWTSVRSSRVILIFPLILMILYAVRIPPKAGLVAAGLALLLALIHVGVVLYCGKHSPTALCLKIPGYGLLAHARALRLDKRFENVLLTCADAAFLLSTVSAIFTCLLYSYVKARSDQRNAAFDQRNAYLIHAGQPQNDAPVPQPEPEAPVLPAVTDEPTQVVELPEEYSGRR